MEPVRHEAHMRGQRRDGSLPIDSASERIFARFGRQLREQRRALNGIELFEAGTVSLLKLF